MDLVISTSAPNEPSKPQRPSGATLRRSALLVWLLALPLFTMGINFCGTVTDRTDRAQQQLDNAISTLNTQSSDWQSTLDKLEAQLHADANDTVDRALARVDVLLQNTIASAGAETVCSTDELAAQVAHELKRIKNEVFLQKAPPPLAPRLCLVVPSAIRTADIESGAVTDLSWHGYDLVASDIRFELENATGARTPISLSLFDDPTIYVSVVNLSAGNGLKIPSDASKLLMLVKDTKVGAVLIERPQVHPPPTPILVNDLTIEFDTGDDDKDHDSRLLVTIDGGATASWQQVGDLTFGDQGVNTVKLNPSSVPLEALNEKTIQICIQTVGNDTWRFNWKLHGFRSDGGLYEQDYGGVQLTNNTPCLSIQLHHIDPPYTNQP